MYTPAAESKVATVKGSYFHPKAYEACDTEPSDAVASLPHLIPDLSSSESDESDAPVLTPPQHGSVMASIRISKPHSHLSRQSPIPRASSQEKLESALSFLPHPPSPVREKRRSPSRSRLGRRGGPKFADDFNQPAADDGCLGGF